MWWVVCKPILVFSLNVDQAEQKCSTYNSVLKQYFRGEILIKEAVRLPWVSKLNIAQTEIEELTNE